MINIVYYKCIFLAHIERSATNKEEEGLDDRSHITIKITKKLNPAPDMNFRLQCVKGVTTVIPRLARHKQGLCRLVHCVHLEFTSPPSLGGRSRLLRYLSSHSSSHICREI